jgi:endonuclease/exonuclease/phosphatase family metal-dependent hydrolase
VTFKTGNRNLVVFVNHWPSQGAPAPVRRAVAEIMMKAASEEIKAGNAVIATGDFNVVSEDRPDPFFEVVNNQTRPYFLLDVHTALKNAAKDLHVDMMTYPAGTYFFPTGFAWNLLDRFFVSPDMLKDGSIVADLKSYQIFNPGFLTESTTIKKGPQAGSVIVGTPHRYNHQATNPGQAGFSDHFPILLNLEVR